MVAPNSDDENVRIKLDFDIVQAIQGMKKAIDAVDSFGEKVNAVTLMATALGNKYKVAASEIAKSFKEANQALKGGINGTVLNSAIGSLEKLQSVTSNIPSKVTPNIKNLGENVSVMGEKLSLTGAKFNDFENKTQSLSSKLLNFNNIARTIFGTLTALAVFQVIQFFAALGQQMVIAAQQADKLVRAIVDLRNIEKILSESGIDVTMEDLFNIVSRLEEKFRLLSKIDLTELVANAAIATREFGFTPAQIESISEVAALLAETQNIDTKSALEATIRALSGKSQGNNVLKQAGIFLNEEVIKHKAIELHLVKEGEALSQNVTAQAALVLLQEKSLGLQSQIADLEQSDAGKVAAVGKAWEELLTSLGSGFYSLIANVSDGLVGIITFAEQMTNRFKLFIATYQAFLYAGRRDIESLLAGDFGNVNDKNTKANFDAYFNNSIRSAFKTPLTEESGIGDKKIVDALNKIITAGDNVTKTTEDINNAFEMTPEQSEKASDALNDLAEDLQKLGERATEMAEKYDTAVARDKEDFDTKNLRQLEDYNRDVFELSRDTNEKLADAQRKHREREAADERKFQERMLELREKFLFDLEDALHERDARQVLRLIRGYNLEKEQEIRKHALENRERAEQNAVELADMRKQAADKLEQLNYEYATKKQRELEDYNEREARRLEDYQKEQAQLQQQIDTRIEKTATALTEIYGLNAEGQAQIYQLLSAYYKPGGVFDSLYDYSYASLVAKTRAMVQELGIIAAQAQGQAAISLPSGKAAEKGGTTKKAIPFASGGMAIANQPTQAVFGEKESELALFIPLSKLANVLGRGAGTAGTSSGNGNSSISLELTLSPDLEARIVKKSVDTVTDVVATVRRNKK